MVMAVRDLEAGRAFYEQLLGCTFTSGDDAEAATFGVKMLFSWDGGIELVAPLEGRDSFVETIINERGEGLIGVVWAVADADRTRDAGAELGISTFFTLDYDQSQIDAKLQGRFSRYYEHFMAASGPLGNLQVVVGEFDEPV